MSCVVLLIGTTTCNKVSADPAGEELRREGGREGGRLLLKVVAGGYYLAARTFVHESNE